MANRRQDGIPASDGASALRNMTKGLGMDTETCDEDAAVCEGKVGVSSLIGDREHKEHTCSATLSVDNTPKPSMTRMTLCEGNGRKLKANSQDCKANEKPRESASGQKASTADASTSTSTSDLQLTQVVELLLAKCGKHADLVLDVILEQTAYDFLPATAWIKSATEGQIAEASAVESMPLLKLVQERLPRCTHCSPLGNLSIQSVTTSGSVMEGLSNNVTSLEIDSDLDTMYEFGPIRVETADDFSTRGWTHAEVTTSNTFSENSTPCQSMSLSESKPVSQSRVSNTELPSGPGEVDQKQHAPTLGPLPRSEALQLRPDPRPRDNQPTPQPPRVIIVPTKNPGFVMLMQPRTPDCQHEHNQMFSSETFYRLMRSVVKFVQTHEVLGDCGPSAELKKHTMLYHVGFDGSDSVPCLRAAWWPADEFVTRERKQDWPPAKAREDIRLYGVHLVAKSAPGTALVYFQWRISFSRAEVIAAWYLTLQQRGALRALKRCKALLGPSGKGVKSYFMKTSLFWLCQETPSAEWTSAVEGARRILDFLEAAVNVRRLPCFFWADINVFQFLSVKELDAMKETIGLLRANMNWLLMRWVAEMLPHFVEPVLQHPARPVPEHELRVCLVRALVSFAIWTSIRRPYGSEWLQWQAKFWVPRLLASSAHIELQALYHKDLGTTFLQTTLFRALLVAPEEVLASTRITQLPGGLMALDPTPLVSLLQPCDKLKLLEEPLAVLAWCLRQHELPPAERPAGVPDNINTPRGFCDLALRTGLLRRALCESVPGFHAKLHAAESRFKQYMRNTWLAQISFTGQFHEYEAKLRKKYDSCKCGNGTVEGRLQHALGLDEDTARSMAALWREELDRLLADPVVRAEYRRKCATLPDAWQLRKYVFNS